MGGARTLAIVQPPSTAPGGNAVTAERWAAIATDLGWEVTRLESWDGTPVDVLVALHARKSHDSVVRFRRAHPDARVVVAGTGTDLYTDVPDSGEVREALGLAHLIVVLQPLAIEALPEELRAFARVIHQSVSPPLPERRPAASGERFVVCQLANLRPVKDPLVLARAVRRLPEASRIRAVHLGGVVDPDLGNQVEAEAADNPRFDWRGHEPREEALRELAGARLLVSASRHEGGSNVVSEALALGVPVVTSRIPGSLGLLGDDYPGTFGVGDDEALAALLERAENEPAFLAELEAACAARQWITAPELEREGWERLLNEVSA